MPEPGPDLKRSVTALGLGILGAENAVQGATTVEVIANHAVKLREQRERITALEATANQLAVRISDLESRWPPT